MPGQANLYRTAVFTVIFLIMFEPFLPVLQNEIFAQTAINLNTEDTLSVENMSEKVPRARRRRLERLKKQGEQAAGTEEAGIQLLKQSTVSEMEPVPVSAGGASDTGVSHEKVDTISAVISQEASVRPSETTSVATSHRRRNREKTSVEVSGDTSSVSSTTMVQHESPVTCDRVNVSDASDSDSIVVRGTVKQNVSQGSALSQKNGENDNALKEKAEVPIPAPSARMKESKSSQVSRTDTVSCETSERDNTSISAVSGEARSGKGGGLEGASQNTAKFYSGPKSKTGETRRSKHYSSGNKRGWQKESTSLNVSNRRFIDIPGLHWAGPYVDRLAERGIIKVSEDRHFYGDRPATRYELAAVSARLLENIEKNYSMISEAGLSSGTVCGEAPVKNDVEQRLLALEEKCDKDRVSFYGDIRLRFLARAQNGRTVLSSNQYRTRAGMKADIDENVKGVLRVSYNDSLHRPFIAGEPSPAVDLAYITAPAFYKVADIKIGRMLEKFGEGLLLDGFFDGLMLKRNVKGTVVTGFAFDDSAVPAGSGLDLKGIGLGRKFLHDKHDVYFYTFRDSAMFNDPFWFALDARGQFNERTGYTFSGSSYDTNRSLSNNTAVFARIAHRAAPKLSISGAFATQGFNYRAKTVNRDLFYLDRGLESPLEDVIDVFNTVTFGNRYVPGTGDIHGFNDFIAGLEYDFNEKLRGKMEANLLSDIGGDGFLAGDISIITARLRHKYSSNFRTELRYRNVDSTFCTSYEDYRLEFMMTF